MQQQAQVSVGDSQDVTNAECDLWLTGLLPHPAATNTIELSYHFIAFFSWM